MNRKSLYVLLTATALTVAPATAASADGGKGDATALKVDGVATVADCHAEQGQANCTGLSVLGNEVTGTDQEGEGESEDALGCTSDAGIPEDQVEACAFRSRSSVDGSGNSSSESDGIWIDVGNGAVQASVLRARAQSNGDAESDGVWLRAGGQEVHVLHAQSEGGEGSSAAAGINGSYYLTDEDTGGAFCPAGVSPVGEAHVICASGATAGVVDDASAAGGAVTGEVVTVNSRGDEDPEAPSPEPPVDTPEAPTPFPPLARTGFDVMSLLMMGGAALASGEAMRRRAEAVDVA